MTLREIRKQLRKTSGRYDLVGADGSDSGANFYINAGARYLDRRTQNKQMVGRKFQRIAAGAYLHYVPDMRAVGEVWVANQESRSRLIKRDWSELRLKYPENPSTADRGGPVDYTPALLRPIPETISQEEQTSLDWVTDYMDVMLANHYKYNGVIIQPAPDTELMLEIVGEFYSTELLLDADENYWSAVHPEVLIMAAMHQLEITMRNKAGAGDWAEAIEMHISEISKDHVDELIADVSKMKG
jgi:hypothetical protein